MEIAVIVEDLPEFSSILADEDVSFIGSTFKEKLIGFWISERIKDIVSEMQSF